MEFKQFADIVNAKFMTLSASGQLFKTNIPKDVLWSTYQDSFSAEDNPIFRERKTHDCQTCYSFIKRVGSIVAVVDGKLDTIWNVEGLSAPYDTVAANMHSLVSQQNISSVFLTNEKLAGREFNIEATEAGDIKWEHFYADIDNAYISQAVAADSGEIDTTVSVFKRALEEFTISSLKTVEDLCDSIYRGAEFKPTVTKFIKAKEAYEQSNKALFIWTDYKKYPAKIRNSAIGTLIVNINEGMDFENAVKAFEAVVAPTNYKRTSAIVTEGMKKQALTTINELNIAESLPRRHASLDDISVNNVLFANKDSQKLMKDSIESLLDATVAKAVITPSTKAAQEISIEDFLKLVETKQPSSIQALIENKHTGNFVSLVAPQHPEAPSILKWNNNFSWSYNGEVTDSIKERVKAAGGSVTGDLRMSLQWNESGSDGFNDLDAHCKTPNTEIYYSNKRDGYGGVLDIDITRPNSQTDDGTAVENITWPDRTKMRNGVYNYFIHNFSGRNSGGFRAQVEFDGEIFEYDYPISVTRDIPVATVTLKDGKFTIEHHLTPSSSQRTEWELNTKQYQKVSTIMLSPNHWDNQSIGNKHYFFMLDGCKNPSPVRGFYNEFLDNDLTPHRKVFEVLSAQMKCEPDDNQLSGIGFSSSMRNDLTVKVDNRPYKIIF